MMMNNNAEPMADSMNADTPTQDELRKDLPRLNRMVAEMWGFTSIHATRSGRLFGNILREPDDYDDISIPIPEFTKSHDACRTFEDAMGEEEWFHYIRTLWITIQTEQSEKDWYTQFPINGLSIEGLETLMKAKPIDRCIARLILAGRIK